MAAGFLANNENAQKIDDLIEDIREAMIEYQVCTPNYPSPPRLTFVLDFVTTRHLRQGFSTHRESHPPHSDRV